MTGVNEGGQKKIIEIKITLSLLRHRSHSKKVSN